MIKHLLKMIWNERRTNGWVVIEFILVFIVLWFCTDFLYEMAKRYIQPTGYDIKHTYMVRFSTLEKKGGWWELRDPMANDSRYADAMTIVERIKRYPGVECVSLSIAAVPYGFSTNGTDFLINSDTVPFYSRFKRVTPSFFDVFKVALVSGRTFSEDERSGDVIISSHDGVSMGGHLIHEIVSIKENKVDSKKNGNVIGVVQTPRPTYLTSTENMIYYILQKEDVDLYRNEVAIRVRPEADIDFETTFMKEMRDQLSVGEYYLTSIESGENAIRKAANSWGTTQKINSTLSITGFLLLNIFMGIVGMYWFIVQSRRSEIGLRIALGSSKRGVLRMYIGETLLILFITSLIAAFICVNISMTSLLEILGLATIYRPVDAPEDYLQPLINYGITFILLASVSIGAVWYPAYQATQIVPAEALKDE